MVDSEYSTDNYRSLEISIRAIIKNLEMLKFVPDHLKTKKICKYAVTKLLIIMLVHYNFSQKYAINLLILLLLQCNLFLNAIKLKKIVIKFLIFDLLSLILFLIDVNPKECVIKLFPKILLW